MACMVAAAMSVREAVADELREKEFRPKELLYRLADKGYSDSDIKQALSEMLHEHRIELTPQRILKLSATQAV